MHSSGDTNLACLVAGGEFVWFLMCTLLVTQTLACLVSEGKLAWFVICTLLVTQTMACLVSVCELAWYSLLVTQTWPVLFQEVSWLGF